MYKRMTEKYTGYGTVRPQPRKYRSVSIPADLVASAERLVNGDDPHGYTSASGFMADAIRRRLEELRHRSPLSFAGEQVEYVKGDD